MISKEVNEKEIWLQNGSELVRVSETATNTIGFGRKRTMTITVFENPMPEQVEAVKLQTIAPNMKCKMKLARQITQNMQSVIKSIANVTAKS